MYRQIGIRFFRLIDRASQFVYRVSDGRLGEVQGNVRMLLLHTVGRKTGKLRTHCIQYQRDGDDYLVVASNFGLPKDPAWYLNLQANPRISIQVGRKRLRVVAHTATPDERNRLWPVIVKNHPPFAGYQAATVREIPVVILSPVSDR
ncbi:MAG TPA: nitroreductase family deazaflavin-dependent oxidoreductase [Aggregatilineales bacterium]|nr:nitroreductase family deazaflavin-dependent oxidoreductase [Aggregatilineales bacterium]